MNADDAQGEDVREMSDEELEALITRMIERARDEGYNEEDDLGPILE